MGWRWSSRMLTWGYATRCFDAAFDRVHFMRNVLTQVPKGSAEMVAAAIRTIFAQPDAPTCAISST